MGDVSKIFFNGEYSFKDNTVRSGLNNKVDKVTGKELMPSDLIVQNKIADSYLPGSTVPNDGVLSIQQNEVTIATFTANQAEDVVVNIQVTPNIIGGALNTSDGTTILPKKADASVTDVITYGNLTTGQSYILKTKVYDTVAGEFLTITKNGVSSTEISSTIIPQSVSGTYTNIFTVDCSGVESESTINVIETLSTASFTSDLTVVMVAVELGLRADFVNSTFTRLGDAVGLSGGSDFDQFPMYQRRRCKLADDGTVNAYYGDSSYDSASGQVMVEQPKFYYKVVPVTLNANDSKQLDVAEYWVSDQPLEGYKLHPAFRNTSMQEIDYFYEGAYEGYVSSSKLGSISGVTPTAYQTRATFRTQAANRGTGWKQETIWSVSADQILMIIEYGMFNMQTALGYGYVSNNNPSALSTGTLNSYGNASYGSTANQTTAVQWRGKENPWGNIFKWIDGINISGRVPYIANSYSFADDTTTNYTSIGFSVGSNRNYARFGYNSNFDWLFMPYGSTSGNSSTPIGDYVSSNSGWRVCLLGGFWSSSLYAGPFDWTLNYSSFESGSVVGGRALFVG